MKPAFAIVIFYGLLAAAVMVVRGDLTSWPRAADHGLACAICLGAVALLLSSWRATQPLADPAEDGSSRPRPTWPWWAGLIGLLGFVFLAVLPPISFWLAPPRPANPQNDGRQSDGAAAEASGQGAQPIPRQGDSAASQDAAASPSLEEGPPMNWTDRIKSALEQRPPWLLAVMALLIVLALAALLWLTRRWWLKAIPSDPSKPPARTAWFDDPDAPRYVREFRRLCHHLGCPPRPGDTWRDMGARLASVKFPVEPLEPVAAYHYRVRYERAAAEPATENDFARLIRAARKAATAAPATETAPAE